MEKSKNKRSFLSNILKAIAIVLGAILLLVAALLAFVSITEYRPSDLESIASEGTAQKTLYVGEPVTLMTWNVGFGALDENSDSFLDGGTMVRAESKEAVLNNMAGICNEIEAIHPDILLLQELDRGSSRSCSVEEYAYISERMDGYAQVFANNYKAAYIPYPLPKTLGKVDSGIATFSVFPMDASDRVRLPVPFSWPMRTINLKRCLLVSRIKVEGTEKELVLVNLHLEAYDDGEGKLAQTGMLAELLKTEAQKGNYVIAGGDFNQIFSTVNADAYPTYGDNWRAPIIDVTEFGDGFSFLMDESAPSCRLLNRPYRDADHASFQYYIIDGFIVSNNILVESLQTQNLGFVHSDHDPVVLRITLN